MKQPTAARSILSPAIDLLCVGGLSILLIVPLLASGRADLLFLDIGVLIWIHALINYSHFMASYRIIYRDREMILRHKWASMGVPLVLLVYCLVAFWQASQGPPLLIGALSLVASSYLAWHYTGQAWGMMASQTYLAGQRFEPLERSLIRAGLRILLVWHVVWFLRIWIGETRLPEPLWLEPLYRVITAATALAAVLGGAGILKFWFRTGRGLPARALVPWVAIFVWYAAMWRWGLPALFLVQLAHAIQYLEFPIRVELNRATRAAAAKATVHMAGYVALLLAASFLIILTVPGTAMSALADFLGTTPKKAASLLVLAFINVHHYFTDGVAWKLSNPEVRKDLFAHLPAPAEAGSKAPRSKGKAPRR